VTAVENSATTTHVGGITGAGFTPGISGNPGGRPKGLTRRVRELVGENGDAIVLFMYELMRNEKARTADRLDAGRWLADRGFGRSVQPVDLDVNQHPLLDLRGFSTEDLEALLGILDKYAPDAREIAESGEIGLGRGELEGSNSRRR
jgi:hypothetical protein